MSFDTRNGLYINTVKSVLTNKTIFYMRTLSKIKEKSITLVEKACLEVHGFREIYEELDDRIHLSGQSESTLKNYARKLAQISLHFGKTPQYISEQEINKYLASLARWSKTPSLSDFKFSVYGLRYCYRFLGLESRLIQLPSIKHNSKLPVVLSYDECKQLFKAPKLLKHRILLSLIYSAGLRVREASRLKLADVDAGRMMIHIRQSKYKKDRYVPLSPMILKGLNRYYSVCKPVEYIFNGSEPGTPMSIGGMRWVLGEAKSKCGFQKRITLHTLRHSYATHLLEHGMDIVTIKELLGHQRLETTLIYLHVVILERCNLFSPFDRLYSDN